jgi:hypothetical protein
VYPLSSAYSTDASKVVSKVSEKPQDNDVIKAIGAGPVGLWTTTQMKLRMMRLRMPEVPMGMDEIRPAYTRTHELMLDKNNFEDCEK